MRAALLVLCAAACAHSPAHPAGAPGGKTIAISSTKFELPDGDWQANNEVAGGAAQAALSFGLDGDGGGAGMFDRRTQIFIHALGGNTQVVNDKPWDRATKVQGDTAVYFTADWKLSRKDARHDKPFMVATFEGSDTNDLRMITVVHAGVDGRQVVHVGGLQCIYPAKEAAALEPVCRRIVDSLRLEP